MSTMTFHRPFDVHDWNRLPEGYPAQLIEGQLVKDAPPVPRHQRLVGRLHLALCRFVDEERVYLGPVGVVLDEHNAFQPDLAVIPRGRTIGPDEVSIGIPALVVEVLSPSTIAYDRGVKSRRYLGGGVDEVWLVDPDGRTIETFSPSRSEVFEFGETATSQAVPEIRIDLAGLFRV